MGVVVLALAAGFLTYSLSVGGVHMKRGDYEISAKFGEAGSLAPGAAVSVAGVKVGTVSEIALEPKTFLAVAKLSIDPTVKLPSDSTAKITSDSLLGGAHVSIAPGAAMDDIKPGGQIANTQGAVDIFGLIGSVIRPQGGNGGESGESGAGEAATAAPATAQPAASY